MKLIRYAEYTGSENMQIDTNILENAIQTSAIEPVFRLYGWKPKCISIGRNQKAGFLSGDIQSVRRLTGGRALLHDNEITYSYVTPISIIPDGESIYSSYRYISGFLTDFFKTLGIELDFGENKRVATHFDYCMLVSTGADVCYKGKKLIGSAQCRKQGYILQHGSILFDYDKVLLEHLFKEKITGITCIKEIVPDISKEELIKLLEIFIKNLN